MVNVAVVGYGNIGRGVLGALKKNKDMSLSAIFTRRPVVVKKEIKDILVLSSDEPELSENVKVDVAILCGGSKDDISVQGPLFARNFSTVDSFDTHADIPAYFKKMDSIARQNGNVSIISAGWDPGIFSLERVLGDSFLPESKGYTFWGRGVSQGHSDAARTVKGVLDARQYTIPVETSLDQVRKGTMKDFSKREMHKRLTYVVAEKGADQERIRKEIVTMPKYYDEYDSEVVFISAEEMKAKHSAYPHGGFVMTSGVTGKNNKEILEYRCQLDSNPEFTGSVLVACARAAARLKALNKPGAYTMLDIPPALYNPQPVDYLRSHYL